MKIQAMIYIKIYCSQSTSLSFVKIPFDNIYMKKHSNSDCIVNVKSDEISNELVKNLSELQIYPNFVINSQPESLPESLSKELVGM